MKSLLLFTFLLISGSSFSQERFVQDEKNFKLYLYDVATSDSVAHISKAQLLGAKELYTNYRWLKIKQVVIYLANSITASETFKAGKKNIITPEMKRYFESLQPGAEIVFL